MHSAIKETILDYLKLHADSNPDKTAFIFLNKDKEHTRLSYAELDARAKKIASYLQRNANDGDRILLSYLPELDFICAFIGCLYAGMVAVPTYPMRSNYHVNRILKIINDSDPKLVLGTRKSLRMMQQQPEFKDFHYVMTESLQVNNHYQPLQTTSDKLIFLQYTSGSTGDPKGVMVNHENLMANINAIHDFFQLKATDSTISWLPMQHDMGLMGNILYPIFCGNTIISMSPTDFLEKPARWLSVISQYKSCISGGPNFGYQLCIDKINEELSDVDLSCWQTACNGSEPIRAETLQAFVNKFAAYGFRSNAFAPCYGMAEATLLISCKPKQQEPLITQVNKTALASGYFEKDNASLQKLVSSGHVHKSYILKIVNPETLKLAEKNAIGEIWINGPSVSKGYWNKPDVNREIFCAKLPKDEHQYFRTGDLGYLDGEELYVTGRLKDLIILQGRNIFPQYVEMAVESSHPAIRPGCTAAFSVERNNQEQLIIVAEIERTYRKANLSPIFNAIRHAVANAAAAIPYSIQLLAPAKAMRTTSGKIQRGPTKAAYEAGILQTIAHEDLMPVNEIDPQAKETTTWVTRFQQTAPHYRNFWLIQELTSLLQKVLSVGDETVIDPQQGFFSLGMDSTTAIDLRNRLQQNLGEQFILSQTLAFDYPNLKLLSTYIESILTDKVSLPSKQYTSVSMDEPIAIIGMSCKFPGNANTPEDFWNNLLNKVDGIIEVPKTRWNIDEYHDPNPDAPGKMVTRYGGFIQNIDKFDADFFGISPREAEFLDPQQRLVLEQSWTALERAGLAPADLMGSSTGVFIGVSSSDYGNLLVKYGESTQPNPYIVSGNALSSVSGRLSYTLGLRGPSLSIDTACSSSLVAIHEGCQSLRHQECDLVICGGVNVILLPDISVNLSNAHMLSPEGHCKTFDEAADGYVRSEGCGILILKRLSDAERERDTILAVIKNSSVRQDGASGGLTVPNGIAQQEVLRKALGNINPFDVDYIEAHGTGTNLGDPIEVSAIGAVYGTHKRTSPLMIGSVKSNMGHTEAAAGVAGVIKAVLALQYKKVPANLHFTKLNPKINLSKIPAIIPTETLPWEKTDQDKRLAGVSSFGFTGTIAHLILEETTSIKAKSTPTVDEPTFYLLPFSAKSAKSLNNLLEKYNEYIEKNKDINLGDLAYTLQVGRQHFNFRAAFIAENIAEIPLLISSERNVQSVTEPTFNNKVAFLFSDNNKLIADVTLLMKYSSVFEQAYNKCRDVFASLLPEALNNPMIEYYIQTFSLQYSLAALWISWGVIPNIAYGTGVGFYTAAMVAGTLSLADAAMLVLVYARYRVTLPTFNRALVVFASSTEVQAWLQQDEFSLLYIDEIHAPTEVTISGPQEVLQRLLNKIKQEGFSVQWLSIISRDYRHLSQEVADTFNTLMQNINFHKPKIEFLRPHDGKLILTLKNEDFLTSLQSPVIGYQVIDAIVKKRVGIFLEIGSQSYITTWGPRYYNKNNIYWLASLQPDTNVWWNILQTLTQLYKAGLTINWAEFEKSYGLHEKIILPTYQFLQQRYWSNVLDEVVKGLYIPNLYPKKIQEEAKYFYESVWQAQELSKVSNEGVTYNGWYILPENALPLFSENHRVSSANNMSDSNHIAQQLEGVTHIMFLLQNVEGVPTSDICIPVLKLIQNLSKLDKMPYLTIVTQNAYSVAGSPIALNMTPINGFIKTAMLEYPGLYLKQLDIDVEDSIEQAMAWVMEEEIQNAKDICIAYRNQRRFIAHLEHAFIPEQLPPLHIDPNAYYMITGGLGGIGFALANWLIEQGAQHLIVLARHEPNSEQIIEINHWKARGVEIELPQIDISQQAQVDTLIQKYKHGAHFLKGIFHLAGTLVDGTIPTQTEERFAKVFAAKALGAWFLHRALQKHGILLDHFILFSSIASLNGSLGQSNYAAANAFLDGLAFYRRQHYLAASSINWGGWADIGMAKALVALHQRAGIQDFKPDKAFNYLELTLRLNPIQTGIIDADWDKMVQVIGAYKPWVEKLLTKAEHEEKTNSIHQFLDLPRKLQSTLLENIISDQIKHVLNLPPETILDKNTTFFTMGLDSLMGYQLINNLRGLSDETLSIKFEHILKRNTVYKLTEYLLDQINQTTNHEEKIGALSTLKTEDLRPQVIIPSDIDFTRPRKVVGEIKNILLTGATGFLGIYLLKELLLNSKAVINCIVRANDETEGRERLQKLAIHYALETYIDFDRIHIIPGDVSLPLLGLNAQTFSELAKKIDAIYHSAAMVNFLYSYEELKKTNVGGVLEILRLATMHVKKPIHYVSTIGVYPTIKPDETIVFDEDTDISISGYLQGGYRQTKWVAELIMLEARARGLPITIYRPDLIMGSTDAGIPNMDDLFTRLLIGVLRLKLIPKVDTQINIMPVDYVSAAIVALSLNKDSENHNYLLQNPKYCGIEDFVQIASQLGYTMDIVDYEKWREALVANINDPNPNPLVPLLPIFPERLIEPADLDEQTEVPGYFQPKFSCEATLKMLDEKIKAKLLSPETLLCIYITYLKNNNLI